MDEITTRKLLSYNYLRKSTQSERTLLLGGFGPFPSIVSEGESEPMCFTCSVMVGAEVLAVTFGEAGQGVAHEERKVENPHGQGSWGKFRKRHGNEVFRGNSCRNLRNAKGFKDNFEKAHLGYDYILL